MIDAIWHFVLAVSQKWYALLTGVLFVLDQLLTWISPRAKDWLDKKWPVDRRRPLEIAALVGLFAVASFEAYQTEYVAHHKSAAELATEQGKNSELLKRLASSKPQQAANDASHGSHGSHGSQDQAQLNNFYVRTSDMLRNLSAMESIEEIEATAPKATALREEVSRWVKAHLGDAYAVKVSRLRSYEFSLPWEKNQHTADEMNRRDAVIDPLRSQMDNLEDIMGMRNPGATQDNQATHSTPLLWQGH